MEDVLTNGFCELTQNDKMVVSGGFTGWQGGACSFLGALAVCCAVPICFANPGAGLSLMGAGFSVMDLDEN